MDLRQKYIAESDIENLIKSIEYQYDVDVRNKTRRKEHVEARVIFAKYLKDNYKLGCSRIGKLLNKNHATILHYFKTFDNWVKYDVDFKRRYLAISEYHRNNFIEQQEGTKLMYDDLYLKVMNEELKKQNEKLESKLNSRLHKLIDLVPNNKESFVFQKLHEIIKYNC